jgi:hypothetical protein
LNPSLCGEKLVANRLSHGTACQLFHVQQVNKIKKKLKNGITFPICVLFAVELLM